MTPATAPHSPLKPGDLVMTAAWLGLVTGIVEGIGWLVLQRFDRITSVWTQVLWIAPAVNLVLFLGLGLFLAALARVVPRRWWVPGSLLVLALAAAGNLVALVLARRVYTLVLPILMLGIAVAMTRRFRRDEAASVAAVRRTLPGVVVATIGLFIGVQSYYAIREWRDVAALVEAEPGAPDVVVVVIDAMRADHLSAYGYPRQTSPFIDALASEGVLFERALSPSPYSLPSHASLLSGLYPYEHGVEWLTFKAFTDATYPSIAESMRGRGYRTAAFSSNPYWFTREEGFGRGFIRFEDFYHSAADMAFRTVFGKIFEVALPRLGWEEIPARKRATESVDRILAWASRASEPPLFAFINLFDTHDPYTPPEPYRSRFAEGTTPGGILNWRIGRDELELSEDERVSEIAAYDGALAYVDDELKRLLGQLAMRRPERETLVIITSDHGEAFGEHQAYLHARSLYREEVMIPLVIHGPGVPAGLRIDRPVTAAAIPATILDLVSGGDAATFGAPSLVPLWTDPAAESGWPFPLAEAAKRDWVNPLFPVRHGDIRSLLSPAWQYIAYDTLPEQLFAWSDTLQQQSRAREPDLAEIMTDFRARMAARPRTPGPR